MNPRKPTSRDRDLFDHRKNTHLCFLEPSKLLYKHDELLFWAYFDARIVCMVRGRMDAAERQSRTSQSTGGRGKKVFIHGGDIHGMTSKAKLSWGSMTLKSQQPARASRFDPTTFSTDELLIVEGKNITLEWKYHARKFWVECVLSLLCATIDRA